jgi:hypothetical protein
MHNGVLRAAEAQRCDVDSQAIGLWLRQGGMDFALKKLRGETFANVFLVDLNSNFFLVHRSVTGTLYTDGRGNYSTNPVGDVALTVQPWSWDCHEIVSSFRLFPKTHADRRDIFTYDPHRTT